MTLSFDHHDPYLPEPLPPQFEAELLEVDRRLAAWSALERESVPGDLEDRVMQRVRAELPALAPLVEVTSPRRARQRAVIGRIGWSRLALAACVGLACLVALSVMKGPAGPADRDLALLSFHEVRRLCDCLRRLRCRAAWPARAAKGLVGADLLRRGRPERTAR